ncbi:hypothetical protein P280DRAFT_16930 [Massarina eburnea CBS 473.64]|uniref:histone acetyltransferase n=1 Tax=Massarina eburnea CBS 473.64 TaxID=1395130 RepID=A0A6A6SKG9_9PLEO|nr:hypothetical protein P280DRAFT_16930 [Massarina eburnea CBS 473.64]
MADSTNKQSLYGLLADQLPENASFTFHHYSTPPTKSAALFSAPPHAKSERTYCESHFLAASIVPKDSPPSAVPEELLVLAIEVLVYSTKSLTTIFVSKADSTGYISLLGLPRSQAASPLQTICGTFVSWLAKARHREGKKVVVSLFARAQDQYLFAASIENPKKHVLDDRGLVKWWCKVLDPIVREYRTQDEAKTLKERLANGAAAETSINKEVGKGGCTAKGYLVIPGFEHYDTLRYIPPSPTPSEPRRWATTHPLLEIAPYPGAPPRCLIPHFPDDPKARFLDELDDELPDRGTDAMTQEGGTPSRSNGQWKSVRTLDQFWELMAFRQECSSGRIVGFIWIVVTPPQPSIPEEDEEEPSQALSSLSRNGSQNSPDSPKRRSRLRKSRRRKANLDYGPIPLILPRTTSSNLSDMVDNPTSAPFKKIPESTPYYIWPSGSQGAVVLSSKDYDRAHEVLLQQNFATRGAAARSTKRWKEEVSVLGGVDNWGRTVVGKKTVQSATGAVATSGAAPVMLMGVRKKRKPNEQRLSESTPSGSTNSPTTLLSEGFVRKKVKVEGSSAEPSAANGVTTLSAGLVRKKPKG